MQHFLPVGDYLVLAHRVQISPTSGAVIILPHWATLFTASMIRARDSVFQAVPFFLRRDISWSCVSLHSQLRPTFALTHASDLQTEELMDQLTIWNVEQCEQGNARSWMW